MALGERLRELRREKGLTQWELGNQIGVSASAVGMYEQNRREPDTNTLLRLCRAFSVGTDYLLRGEERQEISSLLESLRGELLLAPALLFNGEPVSRQDAAEISDAIEAAVMAALTKRADETEENETT